jgi:hypothetical protein
VRHWQGNGRRGTYMGLNPLFLKLSVFRAVEFFIRDKYEKKKYYDKNAIAITNVSKTFIFHQLMLSRFQNIQLNLFIMKHVSCSRLNIGSF